MASSPNKRRAVVSYENMLIKPELSELAAAFAEKYPKGFNDYLPDLMKYDKPDGTSFYAVTIEIPSAIYLVKIKVKTDNLDDIERWLNGEEGSDDEEGASSNESGGELPDDNISQYSTGEDDSQD
ncbi:MAG: hypothetical protein J6P46_01250 [Bacteroidales bacterium]|nr:hypothetical protein [Bacteroidales bacterium]